MLNKRKLIKKQRNNKPASIEETEVDSHQSLFDKLNSNIPAHQEQAITVLANVNCWMPEFAQPGFVRQLIALLYQTNNTICVETIFAMANLCELDPKMASRLFENGLDKALMSLPSTTSELLKPILVFFITVCQNLPTKYNYLLEGIRKSLTVSQIKQNSELCLQFYFRTQNIFSQTKLSEEIMKEIVDISRRTENFIVKSYTVAVIARQHVGNVEVDEMLVNFMTEMLVCIDLAKQYEMNFLLVGNNKNNNLTVTDQADQMIDDEEQHEYQHKTKNQVFSPADREKLRFFQQTINGIEILMEFVLDVLEQVDQWEGDEEEAEGQDMQDEEEDIKELNQKSTNLNNSTSPLQQIILNFIKQNMQIFPKFLTLSSVTVPDTQNIVYLFYHLLVHIDKQLTTQQSQNQQNKLQINQLIQTSLENLFKSIYTQKTQHHETAISFEQYEILVQCLEIGLNVLLKNKAIGVKEDFLLRFAKTYMLAQEIFKSLRLLQQLKPSWMIMLELFSKALNPEKNPNISPEQNYLLGEILKHLIISLPYTELEEFRCQVIDTLFDAYSNQRFDAAFVKLGFMQLLQTIGKQGQQMIGRQMKQKSRKKKQEKFIMDVLKDVKRFLEYKCKMIKK